VIRPIAVVALFAFASGDVAGQPGASFEVASIRLNKSSGPAKARPSPSCPKDSMFRLRLDIR
jgi:hypothetical protein